MSGNSNGKPRRSGVRLPTHLHLVDQLRDDLNNATAKLQRKTADDTAIDNAVLRYRRQRDANGRLTPWKDVAKLVNAERGTNLDGDSARARASRAGKRPCKDPAGLKAMDAELVDLVAKATELYLRIASIICPEVTAPDHVRYLLGSCIHRDWRIPSDPLDTPPEKDQRRRVANLMRNRDVARLFRDCDTLLIRIGYMLFTRQWWTKMFAGEFPAGQGR